MSFEQAAFFYTAGFIFGFAARQLWAVLRG